LKRETEKRYKEKKEEKERKMRKKENNIELHRDKDK
jgi:hypothetical protein